MDRLDDSENKKEDADKVDVADNHTEVKRCSICGSSTTYKDHNKWGEYDHWYGNNEKPICGRCYNRANWKKRFVPLGVKCDNCSSTETIQTKYGTPQWVRNRDGKGGYLCWSCYIIENNTGKVFSQERKNSIRIGIRQAVEAGVIFGKKIHTINESVFDFITEESAYWIGFLMADGSIFKEKTGNPRIALTLAKYDHEHLVKFSKFLNCSYKILRKKTKLNGKIIIQYTLRFSSKHIAEVITKFGVIARKSLIAKVIGLENNRHFWRGVVDGDGYINNRNGQDGDKIILTGSYNLLKQFKTFIETMISGSEATFKQYGKYYRLYIYSYTARAVAELLYKDCSIALERKLIKAQKMCGYAKYHPNTLVAQQIHNLNPQPLQKSDIIASEDDTIPYTQGRESSIED